MRGYGRACAAGLAAVRPGTEIVCFLDGDGSDVPGFIPQVIRPVAEGMAELAHPDPASPGAMVRLP